MDIPCFQVDAFASRAFTGNPAAVCPLEAWLPDDVLLAIANENALSETAFFVREPSGLRLRWFTPENEVDLCGHATLAAAYVLMTRLEPSRTEVAFASRSGKLVVTRSGDDFTLDFPARPPTPVATPEALVAALGKAPRETLSARDLVAVFDSAEDVRALTPDFAAIARMEGVFAVSVTAPGTGQDADVHFVSRFFAPREGIPEDPVTGSAHCTLAPFWSARLGTPTLRARQVSRRGGELSCVVGGDRVWLGGRAVLVKTGTFHVPSGEQR